MAQSLRSPQANSEWIIISKGPEKTSSFVFAVLIPLLLTRPRGLGLGIVIWGLEEGGQVSFRLEA